MMGFVSVEQGQEREVGDVFDVDGGGVGFIFCAKMCVGTEWPVWNVRWPYE